MNTTKSNSIQELQDKADKIDKAVGWISLFIMLYYFNPPSAPMP